MSAGASITSLSSPHATTPESSRSIFSISPFPVLTYINRSASTDKKPIRISPIKPRQQRIQRINPTLHVCTHIMRLAIINRKRNPCRVPCRCHRVQRRPHCRVRLCNRIIPVHQSIPCSCPGGSPFHTQTMRAIALSRKQKLSFPDRSTFPATGPRGFADPGPPPLGGTPSQNLWCIFRTRASNPTP